MPRLRCIQAHLVAYQSQHLRIGFVERRLDLAQRHAVGLAAFQDPRFGLIGAGFKVAAALALARRHQAPGQRDEENPGPGHGQADRREVEHAEGAGIALGAKAGHDQVGRRADQRRHAAQDGAERERHQHPPRRQFQAGRQLDRDRHQQRHRTDVVHEARQHRTQPDQRGQAPAGAGFFWHRVAHQHIDRA